MIDATPDELWWAIRRASCSDPAKAVRVVLFSRADLDKALKLLNYVKEKSNGSCD